MAFLFNSPGIGKTKESRYHVFNPFTLDRTGKTGLFEHTQHKEEDSERQRYESFGESNVKCKNCDEIRSFWKCFRLTSGSGSVYSFSFSLRIQLASKLTRFW